MRQLLFVVVCALWACNDPVAPLATAQPGVLFTYPADKQVDVPTGAHIIASFSEDVSASALSACSGSTTAPTGGFCLVGPDGVVAATPVVVGTNSVEIDADLAEGTTYTAFVSAAVDSQATNLPASGTPLITFTTRSGKPKSAVPTLIAVNGGDPANPESFRPMLTTTTIELLFSEPLDSRSVVMATGALELVDGSGTAVPASMFTDGIHVAIDPKTDLDSQKTYTVKVGNKLLDQSGQPVTPTTVTLSPRDILNGNPPIAQTLRTRQMGDPGTTTSRTGLATNTISINKPLIGKNTTSVQLSELATELGDPAALEGPIAFTIRKGQRLRNSGLDVQLGGMIPLNLSTGDIEIELLTDVGGRLYRNPHQDPTQRPENLRAPLYADLAMDIAIYAVDPKGNAVLAQTILGLTGVGVVTATDGVLDIETVATLDLGLLGVTSAPTNLVLELITETGTSASNADTTPPTIVSTYPAAADNDAPTDIGVDVVFSEPIDIDRARAGGVVLQTGAGVAVPSVIESRGSAIVVRPIQRLAHGAPYKVIFSDVADVAGNALAGTAPLTFATAAIASTDNPAAITTAHPGVGCSLTGATATSPGRCSNATTGGTFNIPVDDLYHPFTIATDEPAAVAFDQPMVPTSFTLATTCGGAGSVHFDIVDMSGTCTAVVKGSLLVHERSFEFIPDAPWEIGTNYKMTLVSGGDSGCAANEICGVKNAASFDILAGMSGAGAAGGPNLVIPYTAVASTGSTFMLATAAPFVDQNGDGAVDGSETGGTQNLSVLNVNDTGGHITSAKFTSGQCQGDANGEDGCLYLSGQMSVAMQPIASGADCALPGGATATTCLPVTIDPGVMYGTSGSLSAQTNLIISLSTDTETSILRVREPASGPVTGYIYSNNGTPTMIVQLDLYMDAPDMSVLQSDHDLHSKQFSVLLSGPLTNLPDGRISIALQNVADIKLQINLDTTVIVDVGQSDVVLKIPAGQMKLQLLSAPLRGGLP